MTSNSNYEQKFVGGAMNDPNIESSGHSDNEAVNQLAISELTEELQMMNVVESSVSEPFPNHSSRGIHYHSNSIRERFPNLHEFYNSDFLSDLIIRIDSSGANSSVQNWSMSTSPDSCTIQTMQQLINNNEETKNSHEVTMIKAHSAIIAIQSKRLQECLINRTILENNRSEEKSKLPDIIIRNYPKEIIVQAINFFYSGKIYISDENVIHFFKLALDLDLKEVKDICEKYLSHCITITNVLLLWQLAIAYDAKELKRSCIDYFKSRTKEIIGFRESSFKDSPLYYISENTIIDLLKKDFKGVSEIEVFHFLIHWASIKRNIDSSLTEKEILRNPIKYLRLIAISRSDLENIIQPTGLVPDEILIEVMFRKLRFQYKIIDRINPEDRNAREADGTPIKFYLRPRRGNWLKLQDFEHEGQYAEYCKNVLVPGMKIRAIRRYENIEAGDEGEFIQHNSGYPPCQISWHLYGNTYWLYWRDLEIVE